MLEAVQQVTLESDLILVVNVYLAAHHAYQPISVLVSHAHWEPILLHQAFASCALQDVLLAPMLLIAPVAQKDMNYRALILAQRVAPSLAQHVMLVSTALLVMEVIHSQEVLVFKVFNAIVVQAAQPVLSVMFSTLVIVPSAQPLIVLDAIMQHLIYVLSATALHSLTPLQISVLLVPAPAALAKHQLSAQIVLMDTTCKL
jgi:hypothetical protein